jgi:hypothetical protein
MVLIIMASHGVCCRIHCCCIVLCYAVIVVYWKFPTVILTCYVLEGISVSRNSLVVIKLVKLRKIYLDLCELVA